jgi:hypothetical protein
MFLATSPAPTSGRDLAPLRLARLGRLSFGPVSDDGPHPVTLRYHADMPFLEARFRASTRNNFTDMAAAACRSLGPYEQVDLVLAAHSGPDVDAHRLPACALAEIVPGDTLALGITDQAVSLPFTALRVAGEYARTDAVRHVLVVLLDQVTLAYGSVPPPELDPVADGAVALLFGPAGPGEGIEVRFFTGVEPGDLPGLLSASPSRHGPPSLIVAGAGVADALPWTAARVLRVPPGRPATGLWWPLAEAGDLGDATTMLVDYDATARQMCVATLVTGRSETDERERTW